MGEIIEIGKLKLSRSKRQYCQHDYLEYNYDEESITCKECKQSIGAFKAFMILVNHYTRAWENINNRQRELAELEQRKGKSLLLATRKVDSAWRSRMIPCCPHCHEPIFPEDGFGGSAVNKEIALAMRKNKIQNP